MTTLAEWCKINNRQDIIDKWSEQNIITPSDLGYGSSKKVFWKCSKGHIWEASPNKMTQRTSVGCPYCANQKVLAGFNALLSKDPEVAAEWHPTKNGTLQPSKVAEHSNKYVWWLCPEGHEYKAMINMRTRKNKKRGCPYCANRRLIKGFNDLKTVCPEVAAEWHPSKNGKLKPTDVLSGSTQIVWWKCPKGHEYKASLVSRVVDGKKRYGCPICASKTVLPGYNDLETLYPYIAKEWDFQKNSISPSEIISGSHQKYWWLCPFGHSYKAAPESRIKENGTGCPICAKELQSSFPEQAIFYYLKQQFPNTENRAILYGKEIDIYIPDENIGIEYDGYRWHKNKSEKEQEKNNYFSEKGIRMLRIKEYRSENEIKQISDTIWIKDRDNQYRNIEYALKEIAGLICFTPIYTVDLEYDNVEIMEMYVSSRKANSLYALRPDIAKEWCISRNGSITPEMVSIKSGKKFWWICPSGHEYQASVYSRTGKNSGCPYCAGQKILKGFNDLQTRYPDIAAEWHPSKNGELTPDSIMPGNSRKVWWMCKEKHEYYTSISNRTNMKSGCPFCAGKLAITGKTDLKTLYPEIAVEWDYEKNGELRPETVKPFSHKKAWWICPNGHSYETAISNRTTNSNKSNGDGCPYCSGKEVLKGFNDLETLFPEIAEKWHPTLNENLLPDMFRPYSTQKVWWTDRDGNAYQRRIDTEVIMYKRKKK